MKPSDAAKELHARTDWMQLRDLREISALGSRAVEVLKGIRAAGLDEFVSSTLLHQIIHIQAGKQYSSTPSNISTALQRFDGALEKRFLESSLKFRFPKAPSTNAEPTRAHSGQVDDVLLNICERFHRA